MKILAICLGTPKAVPGKRFKSGIWKSPRNAAVMVDAEGLVGDAICNRDHHGGPDQAVYVEGGETLKWWESELGYPLEPGAFGENLVIEGLDNRDLGAGDRLVIGDVVLEATAPRTPCATFAAKMDDPMFVKRYTRAGRAGAYFRVITPGLLEAGQTVDYRPYGGDRVTIPQMMEAIASRPDTAQRTRLLDAPISIRLRSFFEKQVP
ncbi:MOSC domain-containing protein [Rhizobium halophytocola]|uniref:MOSC domain-containing protein YiiM n=1 Tax=Rhizobium halophytocola TaxID=735519 RepID=A0ABS4E116_9HYPH|nr:MOSC domain-containing protein [Rhizobium halophytocola]MBP1851623.1 MOSC domain-containing protein YiiM [Rhizobium halophytocola]